MQKINKRTIILAIIFILILVVVALLIGNFTYSFLGADISDDVTTKGETTASGDTLIFSSGNALSLHATTDNFNATSGNLTDTTNPSARLIASSKTNNATATYYAGIRIYENTYTYSTTNQTAEVILTVRDENGNLVTASSDELPYVTVNGVSGFDITGKTGAFNIAAEHPISTTSSTNGTTHTWTFTLTFVNLETDQSINENANLEMDVVLQKDRIAMPTLADLCSGKTLAECITTEVYTTDGENGLYYHDGVGSYTNANQEAGDNSYRYAGANPNNYVCFGSDEEECPTDNLYRIIGIFDGQVKLIKYDYAGESTLGTAQHGSATPDSTYKGSLSSIPYYRWSGSSSNRDNTWSNSTLNTEILNGTYLSTMGSEWASKIATTEWKVGGNTPSNIYDEPVKSTYQNEIVSPAEVTTYSAKIGLMYVSEYGYAASPENWLTNLYDYNTATNRDNNWMYMGDIGWTISRSSDWTDTAFVVYGAGRVDTGSVSSHNGVRPSFSLESDVVLSGGTGSASDPFRIA